MKTTLASSLLRAAALVTLFALPVLASARDDQPADRAAALLARHGTVLVQNAGPYVETGTFQIQVSTALGQPTHRLADGTWLYARYEVEESNARGTLVVRFEKGRVSELTLVTPAVALALISPTKPSGKGLVAHRN